MRTLLLCLVVLTVPVPALAQGNATSPAATAPNKPGQASSQKDPKFETRKKPSDHGSAARKAKTQENIPAEAASDLVNTMTGTGTSQ